MTQSCPNCGSTLRRPGRFCPACGSALTMDSEFVRWRREVCRRQTMMSGFMFLVGMIFLPFFSMTVAMIVCGLSGFGFVVGLRRLSRLTANGVNNEPTEQRDG